MSSSGSAYIMFLVYIVGAMVWTNPKQPLVFLDAHGAYVVIGGFIVIALIAVPWQYIKRFFAMIKTVSRRQSDDAPVVLKQIVEFADKTRGNFTQAKSQLDAIADPFLKDAIQLLIDGFEYEEIERILERRIEVQKEREAAEARMFKNLGKYPPACGLIGTVMGMITLLGSLGTEGAEATIGPSMSVALAATLYGVILANIVILPISDNLLFSGQKKIALREMMKEGILLIKHKESPLLIKELLLAHLTPTQRDMVKSLSN